MTSLGKKCFQKSNHPGILILLLLKMAIFQQPGAGAELQCTVCVGRMEEVCRDRGGLEQSAHLSCCVQEGDKKAPTRGQDRSACHAPETTVDRSRTAEAHAPALWRDDESRPRRSWKGEDPWPSWA